MATIINADTSDVLKLTSDTSGQLELQSGGVTKATVSSSGLTSPGHVLQVVSVTSTAYNNTTGTTYIDSGLTLSITPSSSSNKILVFANVNGTRKANNTALRLQLVRGATVLTIFDTIIGYTNTTTTNSVGTSGLSYLDSPATTSSTTYKIQFSSSSSGNTVELNAGASSTITLMEVAG